MLSVFDFAIRRSKIII